MTRRRIAIIPPSTVLAGDTIELHETSDAGVRTVTTATISEVIYNGTYRVFKMGGEIVFTTDAMKPDHRQCVLMSVRTPTIEPLFRHRNAPE